MNLTDQQENHYINKWVLNHGDPSMKKYDPNSVKNNIKDIVDCLNAQLTDVEKFNLLDKLIGFMLVRNYNDFLQDIKLFDSREEEKERRADKNNVANEFKKRYDWIFGSEMFKSHNSARASVLSALKNKNNRFSVSTQAQQNSLVASRSVNKKAETLAAFFVALDIYPKLNKAALNENPDKEVIKFLSRLFAEIETDILKRFKKLSDIDDEDKDTEGYEPMFDDPEELKDHCIKFVEDSYFTYYDLEKSTLKTIIHSMSGYIWKNLEQDQKDKEQKRFFNKIIELIKFIHFYMVKMPGYQYDEDISIYKKEIGESLTRLLKLQSDYKTKRRTGVERIKDAQDSKDALDSWYYDVFFDNDFYAQYSSYEYDKDESEDQERQKSEDIAKQVRLDYENAFSLTAEKTGDHSYGFTMYLGIMGEDEEFFKEYVTVLRDYQKSLHNIAFMPFDETLYDFIGYFTDITVAYDNNTRRIGIGGKVDFSTRNALDGKKTEEQALNKIADDLAMLKNEVKIIDIINQLRSARKKGKYSPYQGYIYQLYINKDRNRIHARGTINNTNIPPSLTSEPSDEEKEYNRVSDDERAGSFYTDNNTTQPSAASPAATPATEPTTPSSKPTTPTAAPEAKPSSLANDDIFSMF